MGCADVRLLKTIGSVDFTGQERAALNKLTMPPEQLRCTLVPTWRIREAIRFRGSRTFPAIHAHPRHARSLVSDTTKSCSTGKDQIGFKPMQRLLIPCSTFMSRGASVDTQIRPICPAGHTGRHDQRRVMTSSHQTTLFSADMAAVGIAASLT